MRYSLFADCPGCTRTVPGCLLLAVLMPFGPGPERPAEPVVEVRTFNVLVDGKPAGEFTMTISERDGGVVRMTGEADVRVKHLVGTYVYSYRGLEEWKDGRLVRLESDCNDDGKRFKVVAGPENGAMHVKVNGRERVSRSDAWTTTYWRLPDVKYRNHAVPTLDADTGADVNGTLRSVGTSRVIVAGQPRDCAHFQLTGESRVDLWYDEHERLVRQDYVEDGYRTVLELTRVTVRSGNAR